jgi:hypothetical protein
MTKSELIERFAKLYTHHSVPYRGADRGIVFGVPRGMKVGTGARWLQSNNAFRTLRGSSRRANPSTRSFPSVYHETSQWAKAKVATGLRLFQFEIFGGNSK